MRKLVTPECCEDAKYFGNIFLSLDVYSGDSSKQTPRWTIKELSSETFFYLHPELEGMWDSIRQPAPKFCPYCAAPLPEFHPRKTTEKICKVTDGGYYCDTCDERLQNCSCLPPECAWEIVK